MVAGSGLGPRPRTPGHLASSPSLRTAPPNHDGGKPINGVQTDSNNTDNFLWWTGRPLHEAMWYYANRKLLYDKVAGARDFISKGIVTSEKHGTVFVNNVNHAQAYINGTITEGTLEAPFRHTSLPALEAVQSVITPAAPGAHTLHPLPSAFPVTLDDLGPASKRLTINPEMLEQTNEAILRHFTDRITNTELRLQINNTYGHDGVAFIIATEKKLNMPNSVRNSSATARYAMLLDHRKTGLMRVTIAHKQC